MKKKQLPIGPSMFTRTESKMKPFVRVSASEDNLINSDINLNEYDLDKPLVSAEEQLAINEYYENTVNSKAWIQTFSGKKFFPLNPEVGTIDIEDIAHSLSLLCRFTGHCKHFYSVAQHSVLVSYLCDTNDRGHGLLHDSSEAYLVDIPSPLKRVPAFDFYRRAEKHLQNMIYAKFGLSDVEPASVKTADTLMLATEASSLLPNLHREWILPCTPLPVEIKPMSSQEAKQMFLNRFYELFPNEKLDS